MAGVFIGPGSFSGFSTGFLTLDAHIRQGLFGFTHHVQGSGNAHHAVGRSRRNGVADSRPDIQDNFRVRDKGFGLACMYFPSCRSGRNFMKILGIMLFFQVTGRHLWDVCSTGSVIFSSTGTYGE